MVSNAVQTSILVAVLNPLFSDDSVFQPVVRKACTYHPVLNYDIDVCRLGELARHATIVHSMSMFEAVAVCGCAGWKINVIFVLLMEIEAQ